MVAIAEDIRQEIESGEYFIVSRNWYGDRYLSVNSQLVVMAIFGAVICISVYFIVGATLAKYFALQYPVPLYVDDQVEFRSIIKPIASGYESIDTSVARYLVSRYVMDRESYARGGTQSQSMQNKVRRIKQMSSRRAYSNYLQYMDPQRNADSPILKYKLQTVRYIEVTDVVFRGNEGRPSSASVVFKAIEKSPDGEVVSWWNAEIAFCLNSIINVMDYDRGLNFIVVDYEVQPLISKEK